MKTNLVFYIIVLVLTSCAGLYHPEKDTIRFKDIHQFAEMADASYHGNTYIEQKYTEENEVLIFNLDDFEVKYFVIKNHLLKKQYIVVRGTDNFENAITDLQYLKTRDPKTGVFFHSGFLEATDSIYQKLMVEKKNTLSKGYETVLVGHSLGGAIVGILGTYLLDSDIDLKWVITFGQPKFTNETGNLKFKNLPFIRIVNQGDLVPLVPPTSLLSILDGEYEHGGLEIFLTDQGGVEYANVGVYKPEHKKISFWDTLFEDGIDYEKHLMGAYIKKIYKLISKAVYIKFEKGYEWFE
jgi:triacylglycerol lipase